MSLLKNIVVLSLFTLSMNLAMASDGIISMECRPVNPSVTIDDIQSVRVMIDDHIQEYGHVETENSQGEITEYAEFDVRRGNYSSIEIARDESESPTISFTRLESTVHEERIVKTTTSFGRVISVKSALVNCTL